MKLIAYALMIISIIGLNGCSRTIYYKHMSMAENSPNRCVIEYNEDDRTLHIYGKKDSDNFATVDFIDESPPGLFPSKVSVLCRWGLVPDDEDVPVPAQEVKAVFITAWLTTAPAGTQSPPTRIHEIVFHGSSQSDTFINNTNIPSLAYGKEGDDTLIGGQAEDWLYGHEGDDELRGRRGPDKLYGDIGSDDLFGGSGRDELWGDIGSDDLFGGAGPDFLHVKKEPVGMTNTNLLCGGNGPDVLEGAGNEEDLLDSETPNGNDRDADTLIGWSSGNTFY